MGVASEFGGAVGAAGHAGLRAGAGGRAAAPAVYVGGGVFHVHIAVGEVEAVLLIDVVFCDCISEFYIEISDDIFTILLRKKIATLKVAKKYIYSF